MNEWTQFMDMHSGGGRKLQWSFVYIEAPESEAKVIFQNRLGRNPNRITCTCCGPDYSTSEDSLLQVTAYERGCDFDRSTGKWIEQAETGAWSRPYRTIDEYMKDESVLFISATDIKPQERAGVLREEGFVWRV